MAAGSSISWTLVFTALCRFDRRTPLGCILFRLGLLPASSAGDTFCLARRHGNTGSVIAGVLAGIWYCKRHQIDWLALADIVCPAILIGQAIGRMANLLNGDAFGTPTGGNFGLLYPEGTLAFKTYGAVPFSGQRGLGRPAGYRYLRAPAFIPHY